MTPEAIEKELRYRIESEITHQGGKLPERTAIAWGSYLCGLVEWSVIARPTFERLIALVPGANLSALAQRSPAEPETVAQELRDRIRADLERSHGKLSEQQAIAWHAYVCSLYEWSVIRKGFHELIDLLPKLEPPDPVREILTGRPPPGGDTW